MGEAGLGGAFGDLISKAKNVFSKFQINFSAAGPNFFDYAVSFLFFLFGGALFGLGLAVRRLFRKELSRGEILYLVFFLVSSAWLVLFYGGYQFKEFLDESAVVFGSSYLRYWLPLFVFSLPFLAGFLIWLKERRNAFKFLWPAVILILVYACFQLVMLDPYYGLKKTREEDLVPNYRVAEEVIRLTEENAVILAGPDDKIIFPERRVVAYNFNNLPMWKMESLPKIWAQGRPVYYLSLIPAEFGKLNEFLSEENLGFTLIKEIDPRRKLYKLTGLSP